MNRRAIPVTTLLASALLFGCASPANDSAPEELPTRTFRFTYRTTVPAPAGTKVLEVWVPVAMQDAGVQRISDLEVKAPDGHELTTEPVFGNRMIHCRIEGPQPVTTIEWSATITRTEDRGQGALPTSSRYLSSIKRIPLEGKATEMATQLGIANTAGSIHDRAKLIYDDVLNNMAYDKNHDGWGYGDFEHATTVCMGNCTDFHSRFIGIGRAAGIPVRFTMGIPLKPVARGEYNSYHCWAHYYDGRSWHPVDISEADKVVDKDPEKAQWFFRHLDVDRVSISFGRDLMLQPPQNGEALNYFVFPYAEADGKPVPMNKDENWRFIYEDR